MVYKAACVPALVSGFIAVVLLVLTTVSVPTTYHKDTPFDIVRAHNLQGVVDVNSDNANGMTRARFGMWGYCYQPVNSDRFSECTNPLRHDYAVYLADGENANETHHITRNITRGLVTECVALVLAVIAFVLSFIPSLGMELVAAFAYLLATLVTLAAFIVQIIFLVDVKDTFHKLIDNSHVMPGPAFYFTLVSIPLLFFSALTVCCGHRRHRANGDDSSDRRFLKA